MKDCPDCDACYIGESGRRLNEQLIEHAGRDKNSHVLLHSQETGHTRVDINNIEILNKNFATLRGLIFANVGLKKFACIYFCEWAYLKNFVWINFCEGRITNRKRKQKKLKLWCKSSRLNVDSLFNTRDLHFLTPLVTYPSMPITFL